MEGNTDSLGLGVVVLTLRNEQQGRAGAQALLICGMSVPDVAEGVSLVSRIGVRMKVSAHPKRSFCRGVRVS